MLKRKNNKRVISEKLKTEEVVAKPEVRPRKKKRISRETIALFSLGLALLLISLSYRVYRSAVLSFDKIPQKTASAKDDATRPISIQFLPSQYFLSVEETQIASGRWQIAEKGASHADNSARPGEKGSIIIYAHNTKNRFGILTEIKLGDTVSIVTKDGSLHSYIVKEKVVVNPNQTSILDSKGKETLILYTCTGLADMKRLVVKALPL